jgi:hypothetical protein
MSIPCSKNQPNRQVCGKPWANRGQTVGKPWANRGQTMGKPWALHIEQERTMSKEVE